MWSGGQVASLQPRREDLTLGFAAVAERFLGALQEWSAASAAMDVDEDDELLGPSNGTSSTGALTRAPAWSI
jgi:hypothetical protein